MKRFVLIILIAIVGMSTAFSQNRVEVSPEISVTFPRNVKVYESYSEKTSAYTTDAGFAISFIPEEFDTKNVSAITKKLRDLAFNTMRMNRNPDNYFTDRVDLDNAGGLVICGFDHDGDYCMASVVIANTGNKGCYVFSYFDEEYVDTLDDILESIEFN